VPRRPFDIWPTTTPLAATKSGGEESAILCLDLDGFKAVNDGLGHAAGDDLLRQVSQRITALLTSGDFLARMGGDEFVLLPEPGLPLDRVEYLAEQIIAATKVPFELNGEEASCGVSIGILYGNYKWADPDDALRAGDIALYEAKSRGRGCAVHFNPSMDEKRRQRQTIEKDLLAAIADEELILHYQPQFDVKGGALTGFEALVRWQHPTRGLLPPGEFIEIAEELRLIGDISQFVMRRACLDAMNWHPSLRVAVNVSVVEFEAGHLVSSIQEALALSGLPPARLEIEITESILMTHTQLVVKQLNEIRELGVSVAMDDFGIGYSSLSYLWKFPFDKLKIDRSFLLDSQCPEQTRRILGSIVTLGHSLGLKITAEGIEKDNHLKMLKELNCDQAQGFHLGRPMPLAKTLELTTRHFAPAPPDVVPSSRNPTSMLAE